MSVLLRKSLTPPRTNDIFQLAKGSSRRASEPALPQPPPAPALDHLTPDELRVLEQVFEKQERFDREETNRLRRLEAEVTALESQARSQGTGRRLNHVDLRLCRLCFKTKFADGIGRVCFDCHRRVCNKCGSFCKYRGDGRYSGKHTKGRWRCYLCQKRLQLVCASGDWYHGKDARPAALDGVVVRRKCSDVSATTESDWGMGGDHDGYVSSEQSKGNKTDTELGHHETGQQDSPRGGRKAGRRRVASDSTPGSREEEDELEDDDERFLKEREKCRRERLEQHKKMVKKRWMRKSEGNQDNDPEHKKARPRSGSQGRETSTPSRKRKPKPPCAESACQTSDIEDNLKDIPLALHPISSHSREKKRATEGSRGAGPRRWEVEQRSRRYQAFREGMSDHGRSSSDSNVPERVKSVGGDGVVGGAGFHGSDSCTMVCNGGVEALMNPHLASFQKELMNGSSDDLLRRARISSLMRQDAVSISGSNNSVFTDDGTGAARGRPSPRGSMVEIGVELVHGRRSLGEVDTWEVSSERQARPSSSHHALRRRSASPVRSPHMSLVQEEEDGGKGRGSEAYLSVPVVMGTPKLKPRHHAAPKYKEYLMCESSQSTSGASSASSSSDRRTARRKSSTYSRSLSTPYKVVLRKDPRDASCRTCGVGMRVVGGRMGPDGKLGAFVTSVVRGGAADLEGIAEGDQILEWDGSNLQDATFEEARQIMARSGDTVQLIVMHTRQDNVLPSGSRPPERNSKDTPPQDTRRLPHWHPDSDVRRSLDTSGNKPPTRRILPKIPTEQAASSQEPVVDKRVISGRVNLRLWYDENEAMLSVMVLRACSLPCRDGPEREMPHAFAKLFLLPNRTDSEARRTPPVNSTTEPEWNATFSFSNIPTHEICRRSLEVTVWDFYPYKEDQFLGEVLLDLDTANLADEPRWFSLSEHDENSAPLPWPSPKPHAQHRGTCGEPPGAGGRQMWRSLPLLPPTPAHDKVKELLNRRNLAAKTPEGKTNLVLTGEICGSSPQLYRLQISPTSPTHGQEEYARRRSLSPAPGKTDDYKQGDSPRRGTNITSRVKRRMSDVMTKVGKKLVDRRSSSLESACPTGRKGSGKVRRSSTDNTRRHSIHNLAAGLAASRNTGMGAAGSLNMTLLTAPMPLSRSSSQSSSGVLLTTAADTDDDDQFSFNGGSPCRPAPEGNDITSMLGPGQVAPRPSQETLVQGDIRLGFMITKGQLEIDVICAKGLPLSVVKLPPDTYVKTYLVQGTKRLQKKRTKTVKTSTDPMYRQQIKYSACNVHGRHMLITIKERSGGFDKNISMGEVVVKLDSLDLSSHTAGWYKLFQPSSTDLGSTESLA